MEMRKKEKRASGTRTAVFFAAVLLLVLVFMAAGLFSGSSGISPERVLESLLSPESTGKAAQIILKIRLPRVLMAVLLGGALAVSGYLLQVFFGTPIAGPFVLGISSGAKMAVALALIGSLSRAESLSSAGLILVAFCGAFLSTGFILLISRRVDHMASLLVAGIMIGYLCSAVTDFLITFADDADIVNLRGWSMGSFSGISMAQVRAALPVVIAAMALALSLVKPILAVQQGEAYAESVGVNVRRFRFLLILASSLLSACVTAFAGPVSFVGIAVPFAARRILRTARPDVLIPACFLLGSAVTAACDLIARMAFAPTELYIGTVTSFFGAPVVVFMLAERRRG